MHLKGSIVEASNSAVLRAHCPQLFIHSPRVQRVSPSLSHTFTPEGARNATTQDTLSIPAADTKSIRVEDKLKHLRAHMALQIKIPVPEEYRIHVLTWYLEVLCSKSIYVPLHIQGQRRELVGPLDWGDAQLDCPERLRGIREERREDE